MKLGVQEAARLLSVSENPIYRWIQGVRCRSTGSLTSIVLTARICWPGLFAKGDIFDGFFRVQKTCPHCGGTLQPYTGDTASVIGLGYRVFLPPSALRAILAGHYLKWGPFGRLPHSWDQYERAASRLSRNMKSAWIAIVYLMTGFCKNL